MKRMGRPRTQHADMPPGCKLVRGRWYVVAVNRHIARVIAELSGGKKSMPLAPHGRPAPTSKAEARAFYVETFIRPLEQLETAQRGTVAELVARARLDLLPKYASVKGRAEAERYLDEIAQEFGQLPYARNSVDASRGGYLRAMDVQRYLYNQARAETPRPIAGNRVVNTMHGMFTLARTLWGSTEYDPTEGVKRNEEVPRDQLPSAEEFQRVYFAAPEWMQCAMLIARGYARRRGEILGLVDADDTVEGLTLRRGKQRSGRKPRVILIEWDANLRFIIERLKAHKARMLYRASRKHRAALASIELLVNEDGLPVTETGFNSAWRRAVLRAKLKPADFHFHDLRAVRPSFERERANELLAHDDPRATKVYKRGPHIIRAEFGNNSETAGFSETKKAS